MGSGCIRTNWAILLLAVMASITLADPNDWPGFGHDASRHSLAVDGPDILDNSTLDWRAWEDPNGPGYYLEFCGPASPAVFGGKVYVHAMYFTGVNYTHDQIAAYDAQNGTLLWNHLIAKTTVSSDVSWSSPCVDTRTGNVLIGAGPYVYALNGQTGAEIWKTTISGTVMNGSVCLALDLPYARAFITNYTGFSAGGLLYCINLDPNVPGNRYEPGQIVWSDSIGATSGNTPAYRNGYVYVAASQLTGGWMGYGVIYAYHADSNTPNRCWTAGNTNWERFMGGVTVTSAGFVYAATYDFNGGTDNSTLVKINAGDGVTVWTTPAERTDAIPVVAGDRIYLSGGYADPYNPAMRHQIEAFQDHGVSVSKLWETPAGLPVGGWTYQPAYAHGKLYAGVSSSSDARQPYAELYVLNVTLTPSDPGFVIEHFSDGCGGSPAITFDSVYATGTEGLHRFRQPKLLADVDADGSVDLNDLALLASHWLWNGPLGVERTDLDLDGTVTLGDWTWLAHEWLQQVP